MIKVSVLVPVYNVEKYLRQCMESLTNQTLRDIEIICINDGSSDNSLSILREYKLKDSRVKIINKENTGYGHSMNVGLSVAHGKYIAIVESDDFADVNMIEILYEVAEKNNAEVVRSNFWIYKDGNDEFQEMLRGAPYNKVIIPCEMPVYLWGDTFLWTSIYLKKFLDGNKIRFNESPGASYQDVGFTLKVLSCAERMVLLKDAFLHYRSDNEYASIKSVGKVYCKADEIAGVWKFLDNRPDILDKVCCLIPYMMYCLYKADYMRIRLSSKLEFLTRFISEFEELDKKGYLCKKMWDSVLWDEMNRMIRDKEHFFYLAYLDVQKKKLQVHGLLSQICIAEKIYIYGAGRIGRETIKLLQNRKISIAGVFVTAMEDNPSMLHGIDVRPFSATDLVGEQDMVIVSVWRKAREKIISKLYSIGIKKVVVMDEDLYQALRTYVE